MQDLKQVEGPRGPHLFRSSTDPIYLGDEEFVLTLSPLTPKVHRRVDNVQDRPDIPYESSLFQYSSRELDKTYLAQWTPEMVAQAMLDAGIETATADRFVENDINGAILITLKFEDLKELDIPSFGIRTQVWHQVQLLRDSPPCSPRLPTPIEDAPSREIRRETRRVDGAAAVSRQGSKRTQRRRPSTEQDTVHPTESVSIIGIEQTMPKPHNCKKGTNCSKWRRWQRELADFKKLHPHVDDTAYGTVMIYGDVGNPETAKSIDPNDVFRPLSDAQPSVVASSDVMGPGEWPLQFQSLEEATLRNLQTRDPQDNVRQFLNFQQKDNAEYVPPTPPFEIPTAQKAPHRGLRRLPKLSIPDDLRQARAASSRISTAPQAVEADRPQQTRVQSAQPPNFTPYRMERAAPLSPDLETPRNPYRFGTPFSELDVPLTAIPIGPVARDFSQSVPPEMSYRTGPSSGHPPRTQSRASSRRPSVSVLPAVEELRSLAPRSKTPSPKSSPTGRSKTPSQQPPLQPPPRFNYPWSATERSRFEQAIPPMSAFRPGQPFEMPPTLNGVTYQGPMKKRKTRLLRQEWNDGYFTLKGTRLNMHKDAQELDRTLEYVDIDDYAIACSSLASTSKLSAAFKAVHISHNRGKSENVGAFSFQLIPQDKNGGARLRKRDSSMSGFSNQTIPLDGVNGTGKTHHFAVKNRDDRIDWMRELMLAKAMKQKGQGFEISVNGNMI